MTGMKLYYSPGACSLAAHVVLEEIGHPHELVRVHTGYEEHQAPAYLAINPVGLVPTLEVDGQRLTETTAILRYLARTAPNAALEPSEPLPAARVDEVLSRLASLAHPAYRMVIRPDRVAKETGVSQDGLQAIGRRDFATTLDHIEVSLPDEGFVAGAFSIADPYLFVFWSWARYAGFDTDRWPRITRIARTVASRDATRRALVAEALVDAEGRPTPPERV